MDTILKHPKQFDIMQFKSMTCAICCTVVGHVAEKNSV